MTDTYLIEKRGLYYRPNSAGYTGLKSEAGRYSFDDAAVIAGPNGPDGWTDDIEIWKFSEAPDYSSSCPWDVQVKDKADVKINDVSTSYKAWGILDHDGTLFME